MTGNEKMVMRRIIELPQFDTGLYEGCRYLMQNGDAFLDIDVVEVAVPRIAFRKVRWHQFTALHNCTTDPD